MNKETELQTNQNRRELVDSIRSSVQTFFSTRISVLFDSADETIYRKGEAARSLAEQNTLFEFMSTLRRQAPALKARFASELARYLIPLSESSELPKKKNKNAADDNEYQLGLIEQDEMDEMVLLTSLSSKATADLQEELAHLETRLEKLAGETDAVFHKNALAPSRICDAFQATLNSTEFANTHRQILYRLYGKEVTSQLKELYDNLNQLMIDQDILPTIKLKHDITKNKSRPEPARGPAGENTAAGQPGSSAEGGYSSGGGGSQGGASGGYSGGGSQGGGSGGHSGGGSQGHSGGGSQGGGSGGHSGGGSQGGASGGYSSGGGTSQGGASGGHSGGASQGGSHGSAGGSSPGYSGGAGASGGAAPGAGYESNSGTAQTFDGRQYYDAEGNPVQGPAGGQGAAPSGVEHDTGSAQPAAAQPGMPGQRYSAGLPVDQIQDRIRSFVGALPTEAPAGGEAGGAAGGDGEGEGVAGAGNYYSHRDVVDALTSMQAQTRIDPEQEHHFDAAAIKNAVLSTIGQQHGGAVTKRVNQISEKTIDFIKLIFDAIIEDTSITDAIKTLILSLQIPVIKTAMIDEEFFIDDQHPSRLLLDKLAEAGVGINSHHDLVYIELEKIIKKLLKDFVDNVGAFEIALNEVIDLFDKTSQQAEEQEEDTRTDLIHAHARNVVLAEIRKITLGKKLPINVHALVLKAWPTLMFNHYLRHGKNNDEWIELLMMLTTITESIQPVKSIQELEQLGISYDDIVVAVKEKLKGYHKPADVIEKIVEDLEATYTELLETSDLPDEEELPPEQKEPGQTYSTSIEQQQQEADTVKQKLARLPDVVRPGSWFKVYNGEDSIARRLKLGIILVQDATLAFVDYKGSVILEKDADDFTKELESGQSELIMQHSVFDRALNSALSSAEEQPSLMQ